MPNNSELTGGISRRIRCTRCGSDSTPLVTASSQYSGGVDVLFGDGSVKFIKDRINPAIWWALGSKDFGETISADS
ncbi:MAG: DUF1559 domain-containing protein [Isosphaeraceae bacterium]